MHSTFLYYFYFIFLSNFYFIHKQPSCVLWCIDWLLLSWTIFSCFTPWRENTFSNTTFLSTSFWTSIRYLNTLIYSLAFLSNFFCRISFHPFTFFVVVFVVFINDTCWILAWYCRWHCRFWSDNHIIDSCWFECWFRQRWFRTWCFYWLFCPHHHHHRYRYRCKW